MKQFSRQQQIPLSGFSLIEVMVATAIFLVLVTMIGAVFRQASSSWESGTASAEGGSIIRGVIGTIQRELSTAVDGRVYGETWTDPVKVTAGSVEFISIKSLRSDEEDTTNPQNSSREVCRINYTWCGGTMKRTEQRLKPTIDNSGKIKWSSDGSPRPSTIVYQEDPDSMFSADFVFDVVGDANYTTTIKEAVPDFNTDRRWKVPDVSIRGTLTRSGSFSGLEVRSYGRNGVPNNDVAKSKNDDIISN